MMQLLHYFNAPEFIVRMSPLAKKSSTASKNERMFVSDEKINAAFNKTIVTGRPMSPVDLLIRIKYIVDLWYQLMSRQKARLD